MSEQSYEPVETMPLVGGELSLDFTNTASGRGTDHPRDRLAGYGDLLTWGMRVGVLDGADVLELRRAAEARPAKAAAVLAIVRELRETVYRIFSAVAEGGRPRERDLRVLNAHVRAALTRRRLVGGEDGFSWEWEEPDDPLEGLLGPIALSAVELLTSGALPRVKECRNEECTWLFVDASKNRSRRWCEMRDCGNRAKARRHYARRKSKRVSERG